MRPFVLAAVAALALAAAPAAVAKEITKAEVCGAGGCATVDDEAGRAALMNGGSSRTPPAAAPYYNVRIEMSHGDETGASTWPPCRSSARFAPTTAPGTTCRPR